MDIFAAERLPRQPSDSGGKPPESADLIFPSYSVRRTGDNLLKDCCRLKLKVECNLDKYALFHFINSTSNRFHSTHFFFVVVIVVCIVADTN